MDKANGLVLYHEGDLRQHVDGIGLVCPFLELYGNTFHSERALEISRKMINEYATYGVDLKTGIPAQSYHTKSLIKDLRSNWGRGMSWWLLGLLRSDSLQNSTTSIIDKGDSTLLDNYPNYTQYLGALESSASDMSATVPVLYYLIQKGLLKMNRNEFVRIVAPYTDRQGVIRYNSPTIGLPEEKPNAYQAHHLTQGVALLMLSALPDGSDE